MSIFVKGTELAENFLSHQISGDFFFCFVFLLKWMVKTVVMLEPAHVK